MRRFSVLFVAAMGKEKEFAQLLQKQQGVKSVSRIPQGPDLYNVKAIIHASSHEEIGKNMEMLWMKNSGLVCAMRSEKAWWPFVLRR